MDTVCAGGEEETSGPTWKLTYPGYTDKPTVQDWQTHSIK